MASFGADVLPPIVKETPKDALPTITKGTSEDPVFKRLNKHKYYRAVIKCSTFDPVRRRIAEGTSTPDLQIDEQIRRPVKRSDDNLSVTLNSLHGAIDNKNQNNPRQCVVDRLSLRESFDRLGDCERYHRNKPIKSNLEEKYLRGCLSRRLKEELFATGKSSDCKAGYDYFQKHAKEGDRFVASETVGLHVLDEYLLRNDEDLFELLSSADQMKTGVLEWSTVAAALKRKKVPLKKYQILQSMAVLYCYKGGKVNYGDFCEKMLNFRKYKYHRLVAGRDDVSENLMESLEASKDLSIESTGTRLKNQRPVKPRKEVKRQPGMFKVSRSFNKPATKVDNRFWPGAMLDKLRPCYMPGDRKDPESRDHPLFDTIRTETPIRRPPRKRPPFTRYKIYGNNKEI